MSKQIKLDIKEVLKIYCDILRRCPKCNEVMYPLGDLGMEPYHYCFDCKLSIPMREVVG